MIKQNLNEFLYMILGLIYYLMNICKFELFCLFVCVLITVGAGSLIFGLPALGYSFVAVAIVGTVLL